jgi:ParB family transcriptional regulator, chromosome partitioning protein
MASRRSLKEAIQSDVELSGFVFGENFTQTITAEAIEQKAPLAAIHRTSLQKRRYFDQEKLQEWANGEIKTNGIRSSLWVRPLPGGKPGEYELIAGERRYRAAEIIGMTEVPIKVFALDDNQALMASLVENMQRQDLNPLEETEGTLEVLAVELDYSVEQVISLLYQMNNASKGMVNQNVLVSLESQKIERVFSFLGRLTWKSFVSSRLPLLKKPQDILTVLRSGQIEYTKAMAIAQVKDEQQRQQLLNQAISENLSLSEIKVRTKDSEKLSYRDLEQSTEGTDTVLFERRFRDTLKHFKKTKIWSNPKKKSQLEKLLTQLESLMHD